MSGKNDPKAEEALLHAFSGLHDVREIPGFDAPICILCGSWYYLTNVAFSAEERKICPPTHPEYRGFGDNSWLQSQGWEIIRNYRESVGLSRNP